MPATNFSITTTTGPAGLYKFNELPVGTYQITAEAAGFKTITNKGLMLNAGTIQRADFNMQLGQTREVIEVTGEAVSGEHRRFEAWPTRLLSLRWRTFRSMVVTYMT